MKRKILLILTCILCVWLSVFALTACSGGGDDTSDSRNPEIVKIYNMYVASAEEKGTTPLSYEDWLESIKGEKGDDGVGIVDVYVSEDGYLMVKYSNATEYVNVGKVIKEEENNGTEGLKYVMNDDGESISVDGIGMAFEKDIVIPSTYNGYPVTAISEEAFKGCSSLTSVVIGDNVTSIGYGAFHNCDFLTSVILGDSVTNIGHFAFEDCSLLTSVVIGKSVTSIGYEAFYNCYKLVEVINRSSHITIEKGKITNGFVGYCALNVINGSEEYESKVTIDKDGYIIYTDDSDKILIGYTGRETELILPNDITGIKGNAFRNRILLTSVVIGDSVKSIGEEAFAYCDSLTSVVIGGRVESISNSVFRDCSLLTCVMFNGTIAKWNKISKNYGWDFNLAATKVICSDGEVEI